MGWIIRLDPKQTLKQCTKRIKAIDMILRQYINDKQKNDFNEFEHNSSNYTPDGDWTAIPIRKEP